MANNLQDMIFTKCLEHDSKRLPVRMKIVFYANVLIKYDTQLSKGWRNVRVISRLKRDVKKRVLRSKNSKKGGKSN